MDSRGAGLIGWTNCSQLHAAPIRLHEFMEHDIGYIQFREAGPPQAILVCGPERDP